MKEVTKLANTNSLLSKPCWRFNLKIAMPLSSNTITNHYSSQGMDLNMKPDATNITY
jgi:hypothetical protein